MNLDSLSLMPVALTSRSHTSSGVGVLGASRVSFGDCVDALVVSPAARASLAHWESRIQRLRRWQDKDLQAGFTQRVRTFTHEVLFRLTPDDVQRTRAHTEHALGRLQRVTASKPAVEDFDTPFALAFFFHDWLERHGRLPLWQEFWRDVCGEYRCYYVDPLIEQLGSLPRAVLRDAVQWRLGKFYYSALREVYVTATLRHVYGVELRYHLFADLVLKADGWTRGALLYLRVPNTWELRKAHPDGSARRVVSVSIRQPSGGGWGQLWVPDNLADVAAQLAG
jgi:hypothetical protein